MFNNSKYELCSAQVAQLNETPCSVPECNTLGTLSSKSQIHFMLNP